MFLKKLCPVCGRGNIKDEARWGDTRVIEFSCGHLYQEELVSTSEQIDDTASTDGKIMYPFQVEGVKQSIESDARILIGDEMGLGKTVTAIRTLTSRPKSLLPAAVFCKASVRVQWLRECLRWSGMKLSCQPITDSKDKMEVGHDIYIFSLDLLRRLNGLGQEFINCGIKTVIIDECQLIKNHQSQRAIAVRGLSSITPHIIALSGTPIKNRASEFFSVWNMLLPEKFPVYERYLGRWVGIHYDSYGRPKYGGLKYPEQFFEYVKGHYIRRLRDEVMPELPSLDRQFRFYELGEKVQKAYEKELDDMLNYLDGCSSSEQGSFAVQSNTLAYLSRMRHLTGLAKIQPTIDFVDEFLVSCDRQLTVFCHHKDVHQLILAGLKDSCEVVGCPQPLSLTAELTGEERASRQQAFLEGKARVLVASELAFGEGLNLQSCSDCVMVERQWNPANEEQAEARFIRIGQKANCVTSTYMISIGTIDEYLTEIIETKREQIKRSLGDADSVPWDETSIRQQLIEKLQGKRKWRL